MRLLGLRSDFSEMGSVKRPVKGDGPYQSRQG